MNKIFKLFLVSIWLMSTTVMYGYRLPSFSGGEGSEANPYQIATLADLNTLSTTTAHWVAGRYFKQTADIDASSTSTLNSNGAGGYYGFSPIGNNLTTFQGNYNGQGFTITGLYINRPTIDFVGLFGYPETGEIKNIGLLNVAITGKDCVGGLVGINFGTVSKCYSTGSVNGNSHVGGLLGENEATIINCYSTGSIVGIMTNIGGLIGFNGGTINNCYSTGSVNGTYGVGGLLGEDFPENSVISNCFWNTQTSGQTTSAAGTGKTTVQMKTQATFTGWDFPTTWKIDANNNGYPYLAWQVYTPEVIQVTTAKNASTLGLTSTSDVEVADGATLTLDQNITINKLILAPTAKLSMGAQTLGATAGVVLESSADGTATVLGDSPLSNASVQQYVTAGRNWYISSPLSDAGYQELSRGVEVVEWNEVTKNWDAKSSGTLTRGRGYIQIADAVDPGTTGTLSFDGTTNAGNVDVVVTRTESGTGRGFNLVGNPYPSYLDWAKIIANATNANISRTFWYRTQNTTGGYTFVTYNGDGGTYVTSNGTANTAITGKIPPMQGFWIRVNSGTPSTTVRFANDMREHRDADLNKFKAPKVTERASLRLQLRKGIASDETLVYFDANAANTFDNYDSPKMPSDNDEMPELYTKAGSENLVINGLNALTDNMELPLGFSLKESASLSLKVSEMANFVSGTRIYLLDKTEKTQTELYPETEYNFSTTTATANNENRFSLLFRAPGISTGVDKNGENAVNVFVNANNQLMVAAPSNSSYAIYNAVGQKVYNAITTTQLQTVNFKLNTGMYMVKVISNGAETTTKIIIK